MRIISGSLKGRILKTTQKKTLRPTGSLVREAIFDILSSHSFSYKHVLDLYAGVGTFGIEALSRGAQSCVFVERDFATSICLKKNLSTFNLTKQTNVFQKNVLKTIPWIAKNQKSSFDFIFMDPPYYRYPHNLLSSLIQSSLPAPNSIFVVEHHKSVCISPPEQLRCFRKKEYNQTHVSFFLRQIKNKEFS